VVRRQDATLTSDDLIAWSRREMANCKVPRSVVFVRGLPRNAGGKVVKARLGAGAPGGPRTRQRTAAAPLRAAAARPRAEMATGSA
jgi:acyl-CoA synthetase (AMP-forming)/AMP-acid ligase II